MKLRVLIVDLEMSSRAKRWALGIGIPLALLGAAGVAVAGTTPKVFEDNKVLTAADLNASFDAVKIPPGTISAFGGTIDGNPDDMIGDNPPEHLPPAGWLLCKGDSLNGLSSKYAALYAAIGTTFGGNDSSQSFNLPNLQGQFLRGVDPLAALDLDAAGRGPMKPGGNAGILVGSIQGTAVGSHGHDINDPGHSHQYVAVGDGCSASIAAARQYTSSCPYGYSTSSSATGITVKSAGGSESRPPNAYVNFIIKY